MPDEAYVELVRSLFAAPLPSAVMSVLFAGAAVLAWRETADAALGILGVLGIILSVIRLWVVMSTRRRGVSSIIIDRRSARAGERLFLVSYLAFAVDLGIFGARSMLLASSGLHMLVVGLVVGYAAGAAAGVSLRPRICAASMLAAVLPVALAVTMLALLGGGLQSMASRYRAELDKIELRRSISGLARRDCLTDLSNRLGLSERYDQAVAEQSSGCLVAVHCLDLDRFKPVNDRHGHPAGDELLKMVARRLASIVRDGDMVARVGGDEFIMLQLGLRHADEADLLARRMCRVVGESYRISSASVSVGASVGYVVSGYDSSLEQLIAKADNALYAIKALGGGSAAHSDATVEKSLVLYP